MLAVVAFVRFLHIQRRHVGFKGLAIYLKVAHTLLVKAVAGQPIKSVFPSLGTNVATTRSGIPKIIPKGHRKAIGKGDYRVVRFWSSLLSLYRVITFLGKPKISTITSPGASFSLPKYQSFIKLFFLRLGSVDPNLKIGLINPWWPRKIITKSGPGVRPSLHSKISFQKFSGKFVPVNSTSAMIYTLLALANDTVL